MVQHVARACALHARQAVRSFAGAQRTFHQTAYRVAGASAVWKCIPRTRRSRFSRSYELLAGVEYRIELIRERGLGVVRHTVRYDLAPRAQAVRARYEHNAGGERSRGPRSAAHPRPRPPVSSRSCTRHVRCTSRMSRRAERPSSRAVRSGRSSASLVSTATGCDGCGDSVGRISVRRG